MSPTAPSVEPLESTPSTAASILGLLRRQRLKFVLAFAAVGILTVVYLATAKRTYQSDAKLFVRVGRESVSLDPTATTGNFTGVSDTREREVNAVVELLSSRLIAESVVDHFGPNVILGIDEDSQAGLKQTLQQWLSRLNDFNLNPMQVFSHRDEAIAAFQENFSVQAMKTSSVLAMSYQSDRAENSKRMLEFVLQNILEEHLRVHRTTGSQEFFVSQAHLLKVNLTELEEQYRDLKNESGVASLTEQRQIQMSLVGKLKEDLITFMAERDAVLAETQRRQDLLEATPQQIITLETMDQPEAIIQTMREKLYDLEVRERELAAQYKEGHPLLQQLREQLLEARLIMNGEKNTTEKTTGVNPNHQAFDLALQERKASLVALEARTRALSSELAAARTELNRLNEVELQMRQLELEIELTREKYRKYADNLEEARINEELQEAKISSLTVMQPPTLSATPISPKTLQTLGIGFVLACFAGCGLAVFSDKSNMAKVKNVALSPAGTSPRLTQAEYTPPSYGEFEVHGATAPTNPR